MRRNHNIERALYRHLRKFESTPKSLIPPKSVIRLKRKDADMHAIELGDSFRIGYYSKQDGPNCVWLVDANGKYIQTWDQKSILDYFEIIERSNETDTYGAHRDSIRPL